MAFFSFGLYHLQPTNLRNNPSAFLLPLICLHFILSFVWLYLHLD
uniref:Uncharacterized protein n=1 Tax=Manihot esculenta TaxID=3983 RepID=A0A2C9VP63_MANES